MLLDRDGVLEEIAGLLKDLPLFRRPAEVEDVVEALVAHPDFRVYNYGPGWIDVCYLKPVEFISFDLDLTLEP